MSRAVPQRESSVSALKPALGVASQPRSVSAPRHPLPSQTNSTTKNVASPRAAMAAPKPQAHRRLPSEPASRFMTSNVPQPSRPSDPSSRLQTPAQYAHVRSMSVPRVPSYATATNASHQRQTPTTPATPAPSSTQQVRKVSSQTRSVSQPRPQLARKSSHTSEKEMLIPHPPPPEFPPQANHFANSGTGYSSAFMLSDHELEKLVMDEIEMQTTSSPTKKQLPAHSSSSSSLHVMDQISQFRRVSKSEETSIVIQDEEDGWGESASIGKGDLTMFLDAVRRTVDSISGLSHLLHHIKVSPSTTDPRSQDEAESRMRDTMAVLSDLRPALKEATKRMEHIWGKEVKDVMAATSSVIPNPVSANAPSSSSSTMASASNQSSSTSSGGIVRGGSKIIATTTSTKETKPVPANGKIGSKPAKSNSSGSLNNGFNADSAESEHQIPLPPLKVTGDEVVLSREQYEEALAYASLHQKFLSSMLGPFFHLTFVFNFKFPP
jgi:hypothetical protein